MTEIKFGTKRAVTFNETLGEMSADLQFHFCCECGRARGNT